MAAPFAFLQHCSSVSGSQALVPDFGKETRRQKLFLASPSVLCQVTLVEFKPVRQFGGFADNFSSRDNSLHISIIIITKRGAAGNYYICGFFRKWK
jgi:hypothetical protein